MSHEFSLIKHLQARAACRMGHTREAMYAFVYFVYFVWDVITRGYLLRAIYFFTRNSQNSRNGETLRPRGLPDDNHKPSSVIHRPSTLIFCQREFNSNLYTKSLVSLAMVLREDFFFNTNDHKWATNFHEYSTCRLVLPAGRHCPLFKGDERSGGGHTKH